MPARTPHDDPRRGRPRTRALACALAFTAALSPRGATAGETDLLNCTIEELMSAQILECAARYPVTVDDAPAILDVLTAEEIDELHPARLSDLLAQIPGLMVQDDRDMTRLGVRMGPIAGDDNTRVLLLVNGHAAGEHYTGSAPLDGLAAIAPHQIERIEVMRGPGSVLLGSNALAATINLVTRDGADLDGARWHVSAEPHSRTLATDVAWGRSGAESDLALYAQRRVSLGKTRRYDNGAPYEGVPDAQDLTSGRLAWRWGGLRVEGAHAEFERQIPHEWYESLPANRDNRYTKRHSTLSADYALHPHAGHELTVRAFAHSFQGHWWYAYEPYEPELYAWDLWRDEGAERSAGLAADYVLVQAPRLRGAFGLETRRVRAEQHAGYRSLDDREWAYGGDQVPSASRVHEFSIFNTYATGQVILWPRLQVFGGLHWNRTYREERLTPKAGCIVEPGRAWTIKAMAGDGFRTPTLYQRYYTDAELYIDNPDLAPEGVRTFELSLSRRLGRGKSEGWPATQPHLSITLHHSRYRDLIQSSEVLREETPHAGDAQYADTLYQYINLGRIRATGAELGLRGLPLGGWRWGGQMSWQQAEDESGTGQPNTPELVAGLRAGRGWGPWRLSLEARYLGARQSYAGTHLAPHATGHLALCWRPRPGSPRLHLRIDNLLDAEGRVATSWPEFYPVVSVPTEGRSVTLCVEVGG